MIYLTEIQQNKLWNKLLFAKSFSDFLLNRDLYLFRKVLWISLFNDQFASDQSVTAKLKDIVSSFEVISEELEFP